MLEKSDTVVIGLSGGADSVCLLRVLCALSEALGISKERMIALHANHGIRGEEAERDAAFAKELCARLSVTFVEKKRDIHLYAKETGMSLEEAGRSFRYASFHEELRKVSLDSGKIAVAHNRDDMAETVLFHLLRGSGLKGLAGIRPVRDNVVRPLLCVSRQEIEDYLREIGQEFCTDSTNASLDFDRNRIRNQVIPVMREINEHAVEHICACAEEAGRSYEFIHEQAEQTLKKPDVTAEPAVISPAEDEEGSFGRQVTLAVSELYKMSQVMLEHVVSEALAQVAGKGKDLGRKHVLSVAGLLYRDTGRSLALPHGIRARRSYDVLVITNKPEESRDFLVPIDGSGEYCISNVGKLAVTEQTWDGNGEIPKNDYTKVLDYGKIKGNLCVRTPEDGDYIVINKQGDTKRLSRVFIDRKIDREMRASWPVLAVGHEIIWVIGVRYSVAYNVDETTKKVLYLDFQGEGELYGTKDRSFNQ